MEIRARARVTAIFCIGSLLLFWGCSSTKNNLKNERETRIPEEEFPESSLELVDKFWPDVRSSAAFYKQYDGDQQLYEMKFSAENGTWSLAFFPNGDPFDAEKLLSDSTDIPSSARDKITDYLNKRFTNKWKMVRIQQRFVLIDPDDEPYELLEEIVFPDDDDDGYYDDDIAIQYEIKIEGSGPDDFGTFELLFDDMGSIITSAKVINPAEDAMWY